MKWLLGLCCIAACGPETGDRLFVGAEISLTGDLAQIGPEILAAIEMAAVEINKAGGIGKKQLRILHGNDDSDADTSGLVAAKMAKRVSAIIGGIGSAMALEGADAAKVEQAVFLSGSATSPSLTTHDDGGFLFRTAPSDALQGKLLAQRARVRGIQRVAIFYIPGAYGEGLAAAFKTNFEAAGGTVTKNIEYVEGKESYLDDLAMVYADNPEAILLVAYANDGAAFIQNYLSTYTTRGTFWYFGDGLGDPAFITLVGPSNFTFQHEGTTGVAPTTDAYNGYRSRLEAFFGAQPQIGTYSGNYYDAMMLVCLAIAQAKTTDGAALRAALTEVSRGGTKFGPTEVGDALRAISAGMDVDYAGVTGDVDFDEFGDVVGPYDVWKVEEGRVTVIEPSVLP